MRLMQSNYSLECIPSTVAVVPCIKTRSTIILDMKGIDTTSPL